MDLSTGPSTATTFDDEDPFGGEDLLVGPSRSRPRTPKLMERERPRTPGRSGRAALPGDR